MVFFSPIIQFSISNQQVVHLNLKNNNYIENKIQIIINAIFLIIQAIMLINVQEKKLKDHYLSSIIINNISKHQIIHFTTFQFNILSIRPFNLYLYQKFIPY